MFRGLPPGLLGRLAGVTGALAAAAFGSPPAFAAEKRDERRPMPPLARASPNHSEVPVSACRLRRLALMLPAAGGTAFGAAELRRALASEEEGEPNRGLRGNRDRALFDDLPVVNETVVCPSLFWLALPAATLAFQSGSFRRVVSCQKMTQGIGLGMGDFEALAAGGQTAPPQLHHVP